MYRSLLKGLASVLLLASTPLVAQETEEAISFPDEELVAHSIDSLPVQVMRTARSAAPDVFFQSAESYWENDFRVYRISGRLFREVWNVYVREDGKLLRTESDNQDG
jgi:hypothetical protein